MLRCRYPYVSHLICNAGLASFIGICWPLAIKCVLTAPMTAVTSPTYYTQNQGEESVDGFGWVWQCNLFAHFVLVCFSISFPLKQLTVYAVPGTRTTLV